ncbi:DUF2059 domain-containing protein [Rubellimicrobium arenae]|uniref:DUF2059 domain-containing protein n=1 Tax=Rubellimicrobium arenae TaxID=2817372 RepID=UPI001B3161E7|nr:DUF2059 domain-containing protein [Rubellimicrobium arenae]
MFLRSVSVLLLAAGPVLAQSAEPQPASDPSAPDDVRAIYEALLIPEVVDVVVREGQEHGSAIAATMFGPGAEPAAWNGAVASIYDAEHLKSELLDSLVQTLAGEDTAAMRAFLESEPGRSLTALEVSAREEMIDDDVEQAAKEAAAVAMAEESPRLERLQRYAESTDLIEANVAGTMNTNYAYLKGLMNGGAMNPNLAEEDLLSDVWSQESQIRADTTEWVYAFLLKAYEPASDSDIEALIEFSQSGPGQALNHAVFQAFDEQFVEVSRSLGLAAARFMATEEL